MTEPSVEDIVARLESELAELPDEVVVLKARDASALIASWRERGEALERCRTVLGNMALENEGAIFNRWPISHEPLRGDARNLLPVIDAALKDKP